ncbi:hypothetical protein SAPIO_CDS1811 [Scedosporium apiospermum]|uniref:Heterokaryon incompatibility domain-containing protein n=1 Tax=Pseudallescheria apiosperma TaxID=563466 RepID=A0A084GDT1_PSEDA|nr:uncharacterized protein SAPIO_CDS1811 [Scedosporium apiospermum]KEZ45493.1 hypothetical protein SAPIO_CDS1811 [Scedosporium apiospermum]
MPVISQLRSLGASATSDSSPGSEHTTKGIPWADIPKTYQDAVAIVRLLGLRYIWIDSLCIVQDSTEDWEAESAKMCRIYSGGFLTISALSSPNCAAGFPTITSKSITGTTSEGKPYHYFCHSACRHPTDVNTPEGQYSSRDNYDVTDWPLLTRAWVFQERTLSPRVLHFGKDEMIWECDGDCWCECNESNVQSFAPSRQQFRSALRSGTPGVPYIWKQMVSDYSRLSITKESDRLPALSGLAQAIRANSPSSEYLGGLWRETLEMDLLWHSVSVTNMGHPVKHGGGCAPSWSWADRAAYVEFPLCFVDFGSGKEERSMGLLEQWFKVIDVRCQPATADPTGKSQGGRLTLEVDRFAAILRHIGDKQCKPETTWTLSESKKGRRFRSVELFCDSPMHTFLYKASEARITCARLALVEVLGHDDVARRRGVEYVLLLVPSKRDPSAYERVGMLLVQRYLDMNGQRYQNFESPFAGGGRRDIIHIV